MDHKHKKPFPTKYDLAYIEMAEVFAKTSCAERLKVGCLLVKEGRVISLGVNGTPAGWPTNICEDVDGKTSEFVRHAELAALEKLWTSQDTSTGCDVYVTHTPCKGCAVKLVEARVATVVYRHTYRCEQGLQYLKDHGIKVFQI